MKADSREATLKRLEKIRSAHQVQRHSYFVFEVVVQRQLRLKQNLTNTTTNGDLCDVQRCLPW